MRTGTKLKIAALCLAATIPLAACGRDAKDAGADRPMFTENHGLLTVPAASPLRSHLSVQAIGVANQQGMLELPAMVEADPAQVTNILAPLTGRVAALKVKLGEKVRRGQVLAVIASGDMDQAYADDEKAHDAFDLAKKALDRARGVQQAGGAAQKDLEAAQSAYNQAQAELTRAHARLQALGAGSGHGRELVLASPRDGVVTALAISSGAQVSDPTATLMTVANIDHVFVTANVAENQIGSVAIGMSADIALTAYPGQILHGRIAEVDAIVAPDTRRQKARVSLANPGGRLLPNMYATMSLAVPSSSGVSVPQSALLMNNDAVSVLVEVRPWVFQRRAVKIGDETSDWAHIVSGLGAGERVVVKGGVLLND